VPCCLSAALSIYYCVLASRTRPDDARDHFAAPCSYQRLAPPMVVPSYLAFTVTSEQKAPCCILITSVPLDPMAAARCHSNPPLSFLSTTIIHNSITNPSCYQELCLLYCTAYQQSPFGASAIKQQHRQEDQSGEGGVLISIKYIKSKMQGRGLL
jgi:hypothetical protein